MLKIKMSYDTKLEEYPLNGLDSCYVKKHFGNLLPRCLAEIAERRPHDPIEYMSQWLQNAREAELHIKELKSLEMELAKQRLTKEREEELLSLGRPRAPEPPEGSLHRLSSTANYPQAATDSSQTKSRTLLHKESPLKVNGSFHLSDTNEADVTSTERNVRAFLKDDDAQES